MTATGGTGSAPVVSAIVLAAGASTRMGRPKQLLPWDGRPMVRHIAQTYAASMASEVVVVVGCRADAVARAALAVDGEGESQGERGGCDGAPVRVVVNAHWEDGMASSVACGVSAARADAEAFLIALSDHPAVDVGVVDALIAAFAKRAPGERVRTVLSPVHAGRRGHPVLLGSGLRSELAALGGGHRAGSEPGQAPTLRDIVQANTDPATSFVEVESPGIRMDLDTPGDYAEALRRAREWALDVAAESEEGERDGT